MDLLDWLQSTTGLPRLNLYRLQFATSWEPSTNDTARRTADGKVLWHFTMSLDGFVAGPGHDMGWMTDFAYREGLVEEYTSTTGAIIGGRSGWDGIVDGTRPYGGGWKGPIFVLTHHPEGANDPMAGKVVGGHDQHGRPPSQPASGREGGAF